MVAMTAVGNESPVQPLVVVTATAPTPNGPLHVGHMAGPFIAADVAARAARARGCRTLTVSGLDPHQNYVRTKAASQGREVAEVLDEYEDLVRKALDAALIGYDIFNDPRADQGYRSRVAGLLAELASAGAVLTERVTLTRCGACGTTLHHAYVSGDCPRCGRRSSGGTCEACGAFTTAENLTGARCTGCGGRPESIDADIPLLRLESRAAAPGALADRLLPGHRTAGCAAGLPDRLGHPGGS
jgi:methionyl-tRNA synthetase